MGKLREFTTKLISDGKKLFVPYVTSGDPDIETSIEIWKTLARAGADVIEIGIPFSDPLADGPTIQQASLRSLENGTSLRSVLDALKTVRDEITAARVIFSYYNPILKMGLNEFAKAANEAGVSGVLIPDLLPEEAGDLINALEPHNIDPVFLVAPTSTDERLKFIGNASNAMLYAVSLRGVTGVRTTLPPELGEFVARIRTATSSPLVVGFGISTPEQAKVVGELADGVVVGSALVKLIAEYSSASRIELLKQVEEFTKTLSKAAKGE